MVVCLPNQIELLIKSCVASGLLIQVDPKDHCLTGGLLIQVGPKDHCLASGLLIQVDPKNQREKIVGVACRVWESAKRGVAE